jgi:hypothetical protein
MRRNTTIQDKTMNTIAAIAVGIALVDSRSVNNEETSEMISKKMTLIQYKGSSGSRNRLV